MASDIIIAAVNLFAEHTVAPIVKQVKYVWYYKKNMADLVQETEKLERVRNEIQRLVAAAERNAEDVKDSVKTWMKGVDETTAEARKVMEDEENSKKRCFIGLCPNPISRHRFSRKALKKAIQLVDAQNQGKDFQKGSVSVPDAQAPLQGKVTTSSIKGYLNFGSRSETLKDIMEALKDTEVKVIGVYGIGGVGKTTLVKQVTARATEEKLFDEVVMASVTQKKQDVKKFQEEMAKALGMKFDDQLTADRICKRLKMKEKILVILDDLRVVLNLEEVGIPLGADHKGCKVLLTSRFKHVSYSNTAPQKDLMVGVLKEEEAWRLFEEKVGDVVLKNPDFRSVGEEVAKSCSGLPVLIVTVAVALSKRTSLGAWKDALKRLKSKDDNTEMQEIVNSALEFISYDHLKEENKSLFLLCGLLGGDEISITNELLRHGMGWGLFKGVKTVEEVRNRLDTLVLDLKASCLLLDGQDDDFVRMHDVVRDVAISIASKNGDKLVGLEEWPEEDMLRRCTAMTFPYGNIPNLPEHMECPSLEFFLVHHDNSSLKIPDTFFQKMKKLKVLDLTRMCLQPALPSSLSFLESLQTLCLDQCKLKEISIIGELKKLKILSLSNSDIEELPKEVGLLSQLRVLDLYGCSELKVVPPGLLARLSKLEELYMGDSFVQWEVEGLASSRRSNASLAELKHLPNLTTLVIHIPDAKLLPKDLYFRKLERYAIIIGDELWDWSGYEESNISRAMKLNTSTSIHLPAGVKELFKRTEILYLAELKSIYELDWNDFLELKHLHIQNSAETRYIINAVKHRIQDRAFPAILESLFLSNMFELESICNGRLLAESFCKLKIVNVSGCSRLRSLFSFSMARGLPQLQEIQVTECKILEAIVAERIEEYAKTDEVIDKMEFSQLRSLSLKCLPELINFYPDGKRPPTFQKRQKLATTDHMESDEIISEEGSSSAVSFFNQKVSFPRLEALTLSEISNLTEIWHDKPPEMSYCNLKSLVVEKCPHLVDVISSSSLQLSKSSEMVDVSNCESLKEVHVLIDESNCDEKSNGMLSQLIQLSLVDLPKLRCIWSNCRHGILSFKNLTKLRVEKCGGLKYLFTPSIAMGLKLLEEVTVRSCVMMKEIVANEEGEATKDTINFPQLSFLLLEDLPNLTRFCSGSYIVFPSLEELEIMRCPKLETFIFQSVGHDATIGKEVEEIDSSHENLHSTPQPLFSEKVALPSLKGLMISHLDSVKSIWHSQLHVDSFCKLEKLEVKDCAKLFNIFPSIMLKRIQSLKILEIRDSCSIKEIFEVQGLNMEEITNAITVTQLSDLYLENLPELKCVWNKDLLQIFSFQNLQQVNVVKCQLLKNLFPASVARYVHQLKQLAITDCEMEAIVEKEDVEAEVVRFVFPQLTSLFLADLRKLESFYPGKHTTEWPLLKKLYVYNCGKIEIFASEFLSFPEIQGGNQFEKLISNLDSMTISGKDMMMMKTTKHDRFPPDLFRNLKWLCITAFHDKPTASPSELFLQRFHNLKSLTIHDCSFQEIFPYEGPVEEVKHSDEVLFALLRNIRFHHLPKLNYISKEDSLLVPILQKLESLEVWECPGLTNLVPCSVSFKSLEVLDIRKCDGLIFLVQSSIAKSLVQLRVLRVIDCQMIEEIVASKGDDSENVIIFSKLKYLQLESLPNLASFCAGNYTLKFPSLEEVLVERCPNMRTFCRGTTRTPELKRVYLTKDRDKERWNGNLNATIQELFSEMEVPRQAATVPTSSSNNHFEQEAQLCEKSTGSGKEDQVCEKATEQRKEVEIHEKAIKSSRKEAYEISEESQQTPPFSDPSSHNPVNTFVEQTHEGSLAPQNTLIVSPPAQFSPTTNHPAMSPLTIAVGTSMAASGSQQKEFQGLRVTKHFIPLLGEVLQILQTQPLNSISAQQVQFMEDAFRDLSGMNFPMEWLCPYIEKARKCSSVAERQIVISEFELKIAAIEAQVQELNQSKKALEETKKALEDENEAIVSSLDFDKSLYDN